MNAKAAPVDDEDDFGPRTNPDLFGHEDTEAVLKEVHAL